MTLEFYKAEEARLLKALSEKDPSASTDEYYRILSNLEVLGSHAVRTIDIEERLKYYEENNAIDAEDDNVVAPTGKVLKLTAPFTLDHPVEQPFPDPEPEEKTEPTPAPVEEETETPAEVATAEPDKTYSLEEVKAAFIEAARSGIKVAEIIADTGYTKLSDVPSELYGALMRALERKKNGVE